LSLPSREGFLEHGLTFIPYSELKNHTDEPNCPICNQDFTEPAKTPCGHVFCDFCIRTWFDHVEHCPMCNTVHVQPPPPAPLVIDTHIESLYLDFTADQAAVVRELNIFHDIQKLPRAQAPNSTWAESSKVYIDFDILLYQAVGAAIWLKPDMGDDGRLDKLDIARFAWECAVYKIHFELQEDDGAVFDASLFQTRLASRVKVYVNFCAQTHHGYEEPEYSGAEFGTRTLASDLDDLYDYITWRAVQAYETRFFSDLIELEASG